ncbi:G-type lectin S-receptor-like serine/threonine-protein kinase [Thalictrum thalictroides]|uniref:G-type lectin S-receptor-like serine/threonine-protein kinase n=1 Tax=Thalictrum thalictroides TaxID=46969 RepID=A0A7J6VE14_THATH|nr:G-type lectin S-receptor-like serine/threonine-protein kinase [Thalictrum thalictroides]
MWYKTDPNKTVVWVANRDTPLTHDPTSSEFKLLQNGNLVLLNHYSKLTIWSTESAASTNGNVSSEAMLGDDGNLVLRRTGPSADVIWQSFDHPTDTILPGAKIVYNRITKIQQSLTSWRSQNDPAKGLYSVQIDPDEDGIFIKLNPNGNRSWSSGAWNGKLFSLTPEMILVYNLVTFTYVKNVNESYFTYNVYNSLIPNRLVMNLSGQIQYFQLLESSQSWHLFWDKPRQHPCESYSRYCGPFSVCDEKKKPLCRCLNGFIPQSPKDWNLSIFYDGCVRINNLQCDDEVKFLQDYQQFGFFNQQLNDTIKTADDCKQFCLDDCSCNAYAFNSSCLLWKIDVFYRQPSQTYEGQPPSYIQVRVAASKAPGPTSEIPRTTSGGQNFGSLTIVDISRLLISLGSIV